MLRNIQTSGDQRLTTDRDAEHLQIPAFPAQDRRSNIAVAGGRSHSVAVEASRGGIPLRTINWRGRVYRLWALRNSRT